MSRWGKPTKNKKRINPRYFLEEKEQINEDAKEQAADFLTLGSTDASESTENEALFAGAEAIGQSALGDIPGGTASRKAAEEFLTQAPDPGSAGKIGPGSPANIRDHGPDWAKHFGWLRHAGPLGHIIDASEVAGQMLRDQPDQARKAGAGLGGGGLGALGGAKTGATLGMMAGPAAPWVTPVTTGIGMMIGAAGGDQEARQAFDFYNREQGFEGLGAAGASLGRTAMDPAGSVRTALEYWKKKLSDLPPPKPRTPTAASNISSTRRNTAQRRGAELRPGNRVLHREQKGPELIDQIIREELESLLREQFGQSDAWTGEDISYSDPEPDRRQSFSDPSIDAPNYSMTTNPEDLLTLYFDDAGTGWDTAALSATEQGVGQLGQWAQGKTAPGVPDPYAKQIKSQYSSMKNVPQNVSRLSHAVPNSMGRTMSRALPGLSQALGGAEVTGHMLADRPDEAIQAAAGLGGGYAGGAAGATLGAKLGLAGGPYAPVTVPLGALALGTVGAAGGDAAMRELVGAFQDSKAARAGVRGGPEARQAALDRAAQTSPTAPAPAYGRPGRRFENKENKEETLMTENQYKRYQKLAGVEVDKSKRRLNEAGIVASLLTGLGLFLVAQEIHGRTMGYSPRTGQSYSPRPLTAIVNAIKKLKAAAQNKAQQGDTTLDSILNQAEAEGQRLASRFDDEQLARIQEELSDDEQLAEMLTQLGEAPPEAYEQVLSQIEQYIKSKL